MKNVIVCLLLAVMLSFGVQAHVGGISQSTITINETSAIFYNEGSVAALLGDTFEQVTRQKILITNEGDLCTLGPIQYNGNATQGYSFEILCKEKITNLKILDVTLQGYSPMNVIYHVKVNDVPSVFSGSDIIEFTINNKDPWYKVFLTYLKLGLEHILLGFDHITFILGFILLAIGIKPLVKSVSGFTVSHSFTLTLAALGVVTISSRIVEPIIALSIVIVGILGYFQIGEKKISRFWLIFAFGLFHGLGFASAISEIGFPKIGFITALLGFSLGIEFGQLLFVFTAYPLFKFIRKNEKAAKILQKGVSAIVVILGAFWLIQRLI